MVLCIPLGSSRKSTRVMSPEVTYLNENTRHHPRNRNVPVYDRSASTYMRVRQIPAAVATRVRHSRASSPRDFASSWPAEWMHRSMLAWVPGFTSLGHSEKWLSEAHWCQPLRYSLRSRVLSKCISCGSCSAMMILGCSCFPP